MRLYVSGKEVKVLKEVLRAANSKDPETRAIQIRLLERVVLCEQLQNNVESAGK